MPDEVLQDRLQLIVDHAAVIEERLRSVEEESFRDSKKESMIVDSLITRLAALSENIKKIQKIEPLFFKNEIPLDINSIVRFRDLASHHYEKLDHVMIFQICKAKVPLVAQAIQLYLDKLK